MPPPPPNVPPPGQPQWGSQPMGQSPFGAQPMGQPPLGAPPPGYVPYGGPAQGNVQPSSGLSKAMIILYGLSTAAAALVGFALYNRKGAWDDFATAGSLDDLNAADGLVGGTLLLQFVLVLASAIVTSLWAKRIASNAKARGAANVRPGLAAGGWFIPIGWFFVGFNELRKSVAGVGGKSASLGLWQAFFVGQSVVMFVINRFGGFDTLDNPQEVSDALRNQGIIGLVGALIYAAATFFAAKAAKEINAAVSGD